MKTMPSRFIPICAGLLLAVSATVASAQTTVGAPGDLTLRTAGEREITLGGAGATNKELDDSFGSLNFSYGWYTSETQEWVLRQSISYSNPRFGGQSWNGATRIAFDQHLAARGALRPFVGVNAGGVYGDTVSDTFAAGLEAGAKFYVQPRTFIYVLVEYGWFFEDSDDVEDTFSDGQFTYGVGVGFNF
jgi:hypothetical protein